MKLHSVAAMMTLLGILSMACSSGGSGTPGSVGQRGRTRSRWWWRQRAYWLWR